MLIKSAKETTNQINWIYVFTQVKIVISTEEKNIIWLFGTNLQIANITCQGVILMLEKNNFMWIDKKFQISCYYLKQHYVTLTQSNIKKASNCKNWNVWFYWICPQRKVLRKK